MASELELEWPPPPADWQIDPDEIHVWSAVLDRPPEQTSAFASLLSPDEAERAARFHFEQAKTRYIVGRGWLRTVLGQCLRIAPETLRFDYSPRGKPFLSMPVGSSPLHFNLTHSGGLGLLAVTRLGAVGVDVEQIRPLNDADAIAGRFFSPRECAALQAAPLSQKPAAFFNLWTRKEAWLKATGDGIGESLGQVEVSFQADEPARFLSLFGDAKAAVSWRLWELTPARGFTGALAIRAGDAQVRCWRWPQPA